MGLFLNLAYLVIAILASPWLLYRAAIHGDGRGLLMRFGWKIGPALPGCIWLHGASAGEIALLKPLVSLLEKDLPGTPLVISAYSSTGIAAARRTFPTHRVIFFPFDLTFIVSSFLSLFAPRLIVVVESDFWPNFLSLAQRLKIPVAVINGKMSLKSYTRNARFRLLPTLLRHIDLVAVQTQEHAAHFRNLGVPEQRLRVTGNMKYDLVQPLSLPDQALQLRSELGYDSDDVVIIGGSVHEEEDEVLLDAYFELSSGTARSALIIVPRYPRDAARIFRLIEERGQSAVLKTTVDSGDMSCPGSGGVLIVDTVGELRSLYAAADIAFVGGSLFFRGSNKGGHNLMEPAIVSVPVLFGPHHFSFKEIARELLATDAGIQVSDRAELSVAFQSLLDDPERRHGMGNRARNVVVDGQGATLRNYDLLMPLLASTGARLPVSAFDRTMPPTVSDTDSS